MGEFVVDAPDFRARMIRNLASQQLCCFGGAIGPADDVRQCASRSSIFWILAQSVVRQFFRLGTLARAIQHFGEHAAGRAVCGFALDGSAEKARRLVESATQSTRSGTVRR